jgi:hypothetical protein
MLLLFFMYSLPPLVIDKDEAFAVRSTLYPIFRCVTMDRTNFGTAYRSFMAGDLKVFEDGVQPGSPPRGKPPSRNMLAFGLLVGIGLVVVVFSSTLDVGDTGPITTISTDVAPPTLRPVGVAGLIPGFPDALVAVAAVMDSASEEGLALQHVLWPSNRDEVVRDMAVAWRGPGAGSEPRTYLPVAFDASGTYLAVANQTEETGGFELLVARHALLVPVTDHVTSFAWHDSQTGSVAFTTAIDGEWQLHKVEGPPIPQVVMSGLVDDGVVAAWGDWGWAIQSFSGAPRVWLLDPEGTLVSTHRGVAYGSHPLGMVIIVDDDELSVISLGVGMVGDIQRVRSIVPVAAATFSPDGMHLAVLGFQGLKILPVATSGEVAEYEPIVGMPQAVWSSDSRFIMVPGPRGVSVIDTQTNTYQEVLSEHNVGALGVIRQTPGS